MALSGCHLPISCPADSPAHCPRVIVILGGWEASKISRAGSRRLVAGWRLTARLVSAPAMTLNASHCPLLMATSCVTFSWLRIRAR